MRIGILGGIGPEATAEFYSKLIKELQKRKLIKSNADYPQIIINSIPAPELVFDKISDEDLKPYIDGLEFLDKSGADFIVMVCNTIHVFYDYLQKEVRTPILDLRREVKNFLDKKRIRSALVIGTPPAVKSGLYKSDGIRFFGLTGREINKISEAVFNFNKGENKQHQAELVKRICKKYLGKGADTVILACTELALMMDKEKIPKINTMDVMTGATVNKFLSLKYAGSKITKKRVD